MKLSASSRKASDVDPSNTLSQKHPLHGRMRFEIKGKCIEVTAEKRFSLNTFAFELSGLDPLPAYTKGSPAGGVVGAITSAIAIVVLGFAVFLISHEKLRAAFIVLAIVAGFALPFFLWNWYRNRYDIHVIQNRFTKSTAFVLWTSNPNEKEFSTFFDHLLKRIREEVALVESALTGRMSREIRELSHLKDDGVLSVEEFQQAKARLLGTEGSIGFHRR